MTARLAVGIFLAQFFSVVFGFVVLGIVLKLNGYPQEYFGIRWTPFAVLMRERGLWLMLAPLAWSGLAVAANRSERGIISDSFALAVGSRSRSSSGCCSSGRS